MARTLLTLVVLGLIAGSFWLMYRSWQRRVAATADLPDLRVESSDSRSLLRIDHCTYLGTVTSAHWLDRVASHRLGGRGPAAVVVTTDGLRIERIGVADPVFLPCEMLMDVQLASGLAGRTYGRESVAVVTWDWEGQLVHTGVRIADRDLRVAFVGELRSVANGLVRQ